MAGYVRRPGFQVQHDDGKSNFPPLPRPLPNPHGIKAAKFFGLALAVQIALIFVLPLTMFLAAVGFSVGGNTGGVALSGNPVVTAFRWLLTLAFVPALVEGVKGVRTDEENKLAKVVTVATVIIIPVWILT